MHTPAELLDPTIVTFGKLLLAMLLGGLIGTERAVVAKQPAGTRTFGLVALGACLFVVTGLYVDGIYLGILSFDPMHIAASVVTGIGFIGAGLIIFRGESVHGITTAAGLWIAAAVGVATGFGMYAVSFFATVLTLIMFTGMWYIERKFKQWFDVHSPDGRNSSGIAQ